MAKKKKQKKAGIEKRRKNKQQKRTATKRKILASQPAQKKISPAKLKQNLKNIPSLIFEPELQEIAFDPEQVKAVQSQFEKMPDQIEALATPEFNEKLVAQHEMMKQRFEQEGDADKSMMAHAILYFMEQPNSPAYLNQIVVAMYYNALNQIDNKEPLTLKEINALLKTYDEEWADYLKEKADALTAEADDGQEGSEALSANDEGLNGIEPSRFDELVADFVESLESDSAMDEEARERIQEDVEVLVNDYFEDKEITDLQAVRPRRIKTFLESWFIDNMHPTKDDLESMIESLEIFFQFLTKTDKIAADKGAEILDTFKDRETILSNLSI